MTDAGRKTGKVRLMNAKTRTLDGEVSQAGRAGIKQREAGGHTQQYSTCAIFIGFVLLEEKVRCKPFRGCKVDAYPIGLSSPVVEIFTGLMDFVKPSLST